MKASIFRDAPLCREYPGKDVTEKVEEPMRNLTRLIVCMALLTPVLAPAQNAKRKPRTPPPPPVSLAEKAQDKALQIRMGQCTTKAGSGNYKAGTEEFNRYMTTCLHSR
jgi:hypothetical protein